MTVLDTSALVDYLLDRDAVDDVARMLERGGVVAPDVIVFETFSVVRREALQRTLPVERAATAITELGEVSLTLFPTLPLREMAWALRENVSAADALFVALAQILDSPLATKDRGLATAAQAHAGVEVVVLGG